jgi:ATP-dependent RNA helicase DHX37/DHR1
MLEALVGAAHKLGVGMRAFGLAVAVQFPAAALCCNPACVNLQGSSEAALLGPGSRCSGCKVARFCSKECSMAAWKAGHKAVCKRLKAAGAADRAAA